MMKRKFFKTKNTKVIIVNNYFINNESLFSYLLININYITYYLINTNC